MGKRELEHRLDVLDWLLFKGDDYDPPASAPSLLERLEALEAKARDYQEDGVLAMQEQALPIQEESSMRLRVECGPRRPHPFDTCRCGHMRMGHQEDGTCNATCECALFCLPYHHPDGTPDIFAGSTASELVERAEAAERERDEARGDSEVWKHATREFKAERDEAVEARKVWMEVCHTAQSERDAARAALAKIVAIDGEDLRIKCTFGGGLKESKAIATAALNANHS